MLPHDLKGRTLKIDVDESWNIVLITGAELRHRRFALRMQEVFGDRVQAWFQLGRWAAFRRSRGILGKLKSGFVRGREKIYHKYGKEKIKYFINENGVFHGMKRALSTGLPLLRSQLDLSRHRRAISAAERTFLAPELDRLSPFDRLDPVLFESPGDPDFVEQFSALRPFFLLTLGGPLLAKEVLEQVRGAAINQHAGWSPRYRGSFTTEWALYHRDLDHLGVTVHLTTSGADAGPILRRANPSLVSDDTPATCFERVVILGTELMIETVRTLAATGQTMCFDQPPAEGTTYLSDMLSGDVVRAIYRDCARGDLAKALRRYGEF